MTRKHFDRRMKQARLWLQRLRLQGLWPKGLLVERQIFFRSNQKVRFVSLSPRAQVCMAAGAALLAVWLAVGSLSLSGAWNRFADENHLLREQLRDVVASYETRSHNRIEALNDDYRALHTGFDELRHSFFEAVDALETRQQRLRMSLDGHKPLQVPLDEINARLSARVLKTPQKSNRLLAAARKLPRPLMQSRIAPLSPRPAAGKDDAFLRRYAGLEETLAQHYPHIVSAARAARPASAEEWVQEMNGAADSALRRLDAGQSHFISAVEEWIEEDIVRMEGILAIAGLPPEFAPVPDRRLQWQADNGAPGAGGPLLTGAGKIAENIAYDPGAERQLARIADALAHLGILRDAIEGLPLALPLEQEEFYFSSGYGMRDDPFSGERAFHAGMDFSAPYKSPALAAAAGVVTRIGWSGPYGRIVDVDHGNGIMTRYGHLAEYLVQEGDQVAARQPVGLIGSSGRSTGTHLHYEIRVGGRVLNPWHFWRAGHHVVSQR